MNADLKRRDPLLVSIIISTYNYATYLPKAIRSCLNQTYKYLEVIVVDDGSTDNTSDVVQEFIDKIIYVYQENQGVSSARNTGLDHATGDFITFLDADDSLTNDSIEVRLDVLLKHDEIGFVMGESYSEDTYSGRLSYRQKVKKVLISDRFYEDHLMKRISFGPALIRSNLAKRFRFPAHITNGEDVAYFTKISFSAKGCILPKPVAVVGRHPGGQHRDIEKILRQGVNLVSEIIDDPYYGGALNHLRKEFMSIRYLSIFRSLYLSKNYQIARKYYRLALSEKPSNIVKLGYLTKFIKAYLRQ